MKNIWGCTVQIIEGQLGWPKPIFPTTTTTTTPLLKETGSGILLILWINHCWWRKNCTEKEMSLRVTSIDHPNLPSVLITLACRVNSTCGTLSPCQEICIYLHYIRKTPILLGMIWIGLHSWRHLGQNRPWNGLSLRSTKGLNRGFKHTSSTISSNNHCTSCVLSTSKT